MLQRSGRVGASRWAAAWVILLQPVAVTAQNPLYPGVQPFIAVDAPVIAIEHVRVIDGTGSALREDQTIVIAQGKIRDVGPASQIHIAAGAKRLHSTF
jgi:hypothetical protein